MGLFNPSLAISGGRVDEHSWVSDLPLRTDRLLHCLADDGKEMPQPQH